MTFYLYLFPILAIIFYLTFVVVINRRMNGKSRYIDIGLLFAAIVLIYLLFPSIGFILDVLEYGVIADSRLIQGFAINEVVEIQIVYLGFLVSFMIGYAYFRRYYSVNVDGGKNDYKHDVVYILIGMLITYTLSQAISYVYGASVADYISSYTALSSAPLLIQQLQNVLLQAHLSFSIGLVVYGCYSYPNLRKYILIWICSLIAYATIIGGSRTYAFILLLSYILSISFFSNFNFLNLLKYSLSLLFLFSMAGLFRDTDVELNLLNIFFTGEFTSLFINALDLNRYPPDYFDLEFRFRMYFADFLRMIPAQLIGVEKLDPAKWYAETFYSEYQYAGGGFGFGLIAESVVGFGSYEGIVRGLILSFIFAIISNKLLNKKVSLFYVFVYVWLSVTCYLAFRDTTFSLGVRAMYQIIPFLVLLKMASIFSMKK